MLVMWRRRKLVSGSPQPNWMRCFCRRQAGVASTSSRRAAARRRSAVVVILYQPLEALQVDLRHALAGEVAERRQDDHGVDAGVLALDGAEALAEGHVDVVDLL